ncbi:hypothetical protein [Alcaligenes faecalis]|uniref:hypothetical protein n=1 Tax=Alcaligenes faecalis TaxID=511 RepID=UPI001EF0102A|nr:hypothetical protein [Alcaligenes faecalis]ULH05360.1 hypothetical protein MF263_11705 [Alcaligenes faecalis]
MIENPFGESAPSAEQRNYLVLISASKDNAALAQKYLKNLQSLVDRNAAPLWIDSKGAGVFLSTELVAAEIWNAALDGVNHVEGTATKDLLVVELGADWLARKDAKTEHWLKTHIGSPRFIPRERQPRRRY